MISEPSKPQEANISKPDVLMNSEPSKKDDQKISEPAKPDHTEVKPDPPAAAPKARMTWDDIKKEVDDFNNILSRLESKLPKAFPGFKEVHDSLADINMDFVPFERRVTHMHQFFFHHLEDREKLLKNLNQ